MFLNNERIKDILIAILTGAVVAFVTTFLEGAIDFMRGFENNATGGVAASIMYALKRV